jgi:lysosomal acid lipase/cholesteryl ester hydrolase
LENIFDCQIVESSPRIPNGISNGESEGPRPVVLVIHGLLCSSADWVISTPSKGLGGTGRCFLIADEVASPLAAGYMLADAGYDVWLGNYRGNTYSRNHTFLNPDAWLTHKFWDFTWDEMAKYDIPSMVEKVLEVTGQDDLLYAGHSMGTTTFMAMGYYRPDIMDR